MWISKIFPALVLMALISNSAFANDDMISHEITMGKIEAAEKAQIEAEEQTRLALLDETQALLKMAMALQEEIALTQSDSGGMISALGQMIYVLDKNAIKLSFGVMSSAEMADINAANLEAKELLQLNK